MVQLIPDVLAPEIKSPAEKRLFIEFRDHRTNKKYVVLHSLGIAEHANNIFGEIDFVFSAMKACCVLKLRVDRFPAETVCGNLQTATAKYPIKMKGRSSRCRVICNP